MDFEINIDPPERSGGVVETRTRPVAGVIAPV
jgi:hypothetical protein